MSLTPERRVTPPGLSVHSLVNAGITQERINEIPSLRVEAAERSTSSLSQSSLVSTKGNVLDNVYSPIATMLVNASVGTLLVLSLFVLVLGGDTVITLYKLFGFIMAFSLVFIVGYGGFLWWLSWVHETLKLDSRTTLLLLVSSLGGEIVSWLICQLVGVVTDYNLPLSLTFYVVHSVTMAAVFVFVVHQRGPDAIMAHETGTFVCITIVMHYIAWNLFSVLLPRLLYSLIVYGSCSLAICSILVLSKHMPSVSLIGLKRMLKQESGKRDVLPASYVGRRFSNASIMSNVSSIRPRNSITDQSTFSGYQDTIDVDGLTEANGMIGDLLFQEDRLTQKGRESLKKIQQLLTIRNPSTAVQYIPRSRLGSNESDITSAGSSYSPGSTRRVSFSHRQVNQSSQFTTTTTSTGLPNVEKDPLERKRSQASRDRSRMSLVEGGRPSIHRISSPLIRQYKKSLPNLSPHTSSNNYTDSSITATSSSDISDGGGVSDDDRIARVKKMSAKSNSLDVISEQDEGKKDNSALVKNVLVKSVSDSEATDVGIESSLTSRNSLVAISDKVPLYFNKYTEPPLASVEKYENESTDLLEQVENWDFPIFEMEKLSNGCVLSQMAFCLFKGAGLMETFNIPQQEFINYFRALEANYGTKTYHNRTHAADVLHATSYLMFEEIPEFSYDPSDLIEDGNDGSRQWIGNLRSKVSSGNIASAFSILEVFACYLAAAMHDFDHPGRTNAFLVSTRSPLAVLYNDRSVLENHHAAASWDLLISHKDKNFLTNLDSSEMKRLRFLIIECILATDLKHHFEIVGNFREKFDPDTSGGIDWGNDVDRLQVMKMVIKMADINTPTKNLELHRSWTVCITEEFYQQHEDEMRLSLPRTIFMDRHEKEKLPAIQVSFIQNLVAPLFRACAEVGIIPGVVEPVVSTSSGHGLADEDASSDEVIDEDSVPEEAALIRPTKKIFSVILNNLQMNYEAWKDELPKETTNDTDLTDDTELTDDDDD